jgi:preprotein translocase subunit SecG
MYTIFIIIHFIIVFFLIAAILMQPSQSDDLAGIGGGSNHNLMSGHSTKNFLNSLTKVLATMFIVNCLILANIANRDANKSSAIENILQQQEDMKAKQQNTEPAEMVIPSGVQ